MRWAPVMRANARQARTTRRLTCDLWVMEKVAAELRADNAALQRQCELLMEWCPSDLRALNIDEEA